MLSLHSANLIYVLSNFEILKEINKKVTVWNDN